MKKKLFFLAVAAVALASCSNDETIASQANSEANEISFRPLMNNVTRAADIATGTLAGFKVYAFATGTTSSPLINNDEFTGSSTYTSAKKYYWPTSGNLDFYAWSANSSSNNRNTNVTATAYNTFNVTVDATASNQADFIYAVSMNTAKPASGAGVSLTFNHQESRIVLKVKNTAADLKFEVTGWKIVYPDNVGTITFNGTTPTWSNNTDQAVGNEFTSSFDAATISANTASANEIAGNQAMIMIPQSITAPNAYTGAASTAIAGPYMAIQYVAKTTGDATYQTQIWGCCPIPTIAEGWVAGKQYTYTIDLADGGYFETNQDADSGLDPILAGNVIKFASVTVSDWDTTPGNTDIGM